MCIICNMPDYDKSGSEFLLRFSAASKAMKAATDAMLACAKVANTPEAKARYDATHKAMVRATKDWNRLEETREQGHVPISQQPNSQT